MQMNEKRRVIRRDPTPPDRLPPFDPINATAPTPVPVAARRAGRSKGWGIVEFEHPEEVSGFAALPEGFVRGCATAAAAAMQMQKDA
eukprot:339352-Chlamydomonas_euryale.AAC.2